MKLLKEASVRTNEIPRTVNPDGIIHCNKEIFVASDAYTAIKITNHNFSSKHCVGSISHNKESQMKNTF